MALDAHGLPPAADAPPQNLVPPARADDASARRVLRQFRMVFSAVRRHFQLMEKRAGIGGAQIWALSLIAERPGLGIGQLAAAMDIHQSTASNLARALVRQGLVLARKADADRRVTELQLLDSGRALLLRVPPPHAGLLPHELAGLDEPTLAALEGHLATLIHRLRVDEASAQTPLAML